jgi:hypothetical protein
MAEQRRDSELNLTPEGAQALCGLASIHLYSRQGTPATGAG